MTDLRSRSALLEKFETLKNNPNNRLHEVVFLDGAMSVIDAAPAVDAEPARHGRWVDKTKWIHGLPDYRFECSECSYAVWSPTDKTNYCPECGAKMDGDT